MRPLFEAIIPRMRSLQHEYALRPRNPVPPVIPGQTEVARPRGDIRLSEVVVLAGAPTESEWERVRAFVRRTSRESLRLRFGQAADFADDHTLKRFFDIKGGGGEMIWILEEGGDICAIAHLVRPSSAQAEIALIVRTDCARRGIGEMLLRTTLARAARRNLGTLSALVLHENTAMLRLARKVGFEACKSLGLVVELEFDLSQLQRAAGTALADAGVSDDSIEAVAR
jgi:RimJ/RimL family protein N-acetyltransferase